MSAERPLEGIRVADFGQFIAGPAVAMMLAELGADVVKVEPVDGEVSRISGRFGVAMVRTNNRDKRGLALDLRAEAGREVARRLVAASDVLVENMRPGAMARLGLGAEELTARHPALVCLSITAFGRDASPTRVGLDIAAQAESGMMAVTGEAHGDPQRIGFTVVDDATAYAATSAVLAALLRRTRTGLGAIIDTSLLQVAVHLQGPAWTDYLASGIEPTRKGNGQPAVAPAAELFTVSDGQIVVSAYTPAHWARLCVLLDRPGLVTDPRFADNDARVAHRVEMRSVIDEALRRYTVEEAVDVLGRAGIVVGAVRSYAQVVAGEDARRLGLFEETAGPEAYRYVAPPFAFRGEHRPISRSAPAVGEHSAEVLAELGYGAAEIERLVEQRVVAGP